MRQPQETDYDEFVLAEWNGLFRTAYLLTGDYHLAEDLLQATLTKVYIAWSRVSTVERPAAYARKVMSNQAVSWWRKRSAGELPSAELADVGAPSHEGRVTQAAAVWTALATLPPRQRAVIVLRYYEDLTEAEIADALDISVGTVKSHAHLAMASLGKLVGLDDSTVVTNGDLA